MDPLFPYQESGSRWLASRIVGLLADEMGLGKSAQAITACDIVGAQRVLVLCPAAARINWKREFEKFSLFDRDIHIVVDKSTPVPLEAEIVIASYGLADPSRIHGSFDVLIIDEAHFAKSVDAKRSGHVWGRAGLVRQARRVWALSGTPAPNHPGELWCLLYTFGATRLSYDEFISRYCHSYQTAHGPQITGARRENLPELAKILDTLMLRRKKEDVMKELPPISFHAMTVEAGPVDIELEPSFAQYVIPEDRRAELFQKLDRERDLVRTLTGALGTGNDWVKGLEVMAQSVSTLRRYVGLQKVQAVADLVSEELTAKAYEKIVIFAIHRDVIEGLRVKLLRFKPVTLYGGTHHETRQKNIDKFQTNPTCRVFIGNIAAAGTAITLTAAHQVLFIEQDWTPGANAQAAMRCHRIGQTKPVTVRFVGLEDSIDVRVSQVLKNKTRDLTTLFDERDVATISTQC